MMVASTLALVFMTAFILLSSWGYYRHFRINRPPIGTINLSDIFFMMVGIVLFPYLYIFLPVWLITSLLTLGTASLIHLTLEPVLKSRILIWLFILGLLGLEYSLYFIFSGSSAVFLLMNNLLIILSVVSLANFYAQAGMKARDLTILACFLAI